MKPLAKNSGIDLVCEVAAGAYLLESDEYQLRQVLVNLAMNGIQSAEKEGTNVRLSLSQVAGDLV